jgi:cell division protein ZapA
MAENRNLTLNIGGRKHVISIAPAEEPHLLMLGAMIDERIRKLGLAHGQTEARMLLIAALTLADELYALKNPPTDAPPPAPEPEPEPEPAPEPTPAPPAAPAPISPDLIARVAHLADRVEKLAARLEQSDT